MGRTRSPKSRGLPPNLYWFAPRGVYRYRHPVTKKDHYMNGNKAECVAAAKKLNAILMPGNDLVSRVVSGRVSMPDMLDGFRRDELDKRDLADKTLISYRSYLDRLKKQFADYNVSDVTVRDLAQGLDKLTTGARMRNQFRSLLADALRYAISEGMRDDNPAEVLRKVPTKRARMRLTRESYAAVREQAPHWLQIAMDVALYSLQRREDVVVMQYPEDGKLWVKQKKTGARLAITPSGRLMRAIAESRTAACPLVVHAKPERMKPKHQRATDRIHPMQVMPDKLSRAFAKARDASGYYTGENSPPTFHEIRSLGAHLYRDAGYAEEYIQALLGHEDVAQTRVYLDGHKRKWMEVTADL